MKTIEALGIRPGITSVIGSGGKTTLLATLARTLPGACVLTTTTHILPFPGCPLLLDPTEGQIEQALWYSRVVCVGSPATGATKTDAEGTEHDTGASYQGKLAAPTLKMSTIAALADYVLVEADGSKRLPLKAHGDFEPVVPEGSQLTIQVVGASGFGRPVCEAVHRPGLFCARAGCSPEDVATPERVAQAIAAERDARVATADVIVVNQAESRMADARALAVALHAAGVDVPVWAGSVRDDALENVTAR